MRKNFIHINEGFICKKCGENNPPSKKTCRNHCKKCLHSLHVDKDVPGDRLSTCKALMEPVFIDQKAKKGFIVFHKCTKCGKMIPNKVSDDDNQEELIRISSNPKPQNA
jgi:ribosomal protein L40E